MRRCTGFKPSRTSGSARDTITLAFDDRFRRRIKLVADGGLAVALAECCFNFESASLGGDFDIGDVSGGDDFDDVEPTRTDALLFSEGPSRMIVSTRDPEVVEARATRRSSTPSVSSSPAEVGRHTDWLRSLSPWPVDGFGLDRMRALLAALGGLFIVAGGALGHLVRRPR